MSTQIVIVGVGGIGGYFGGKLAYFAGADQRGAEVTFIARGQHLASIEADGLRLKTPGGKEYVCRPARVTDALEDIPEADFVFLATKSYDLDAVLERVKHACREDTVITAPLNGLDVYERIKRHIPQSLVLPSCVYISSAITSSGEVTQFGGAGKLICGPDPERPGERADQILELITDAAIAAAWSDSVVKEIWGKYMFIAPLCLLTSTENKTIGEVLESEESSSKMVSLIGELNAISEKMSIGLADDIVDKCVASSRAFPFDTKTSFQRDVEARKPQNEIDLFGDTILRLGAEHDVPTPVATALVTGLKQMMAGW